jgi:hypothetical protein
MRNDPGKRAEVKLYDTLSQQLRGIWVIFYQVAWPGRTTAAGAPRDGETDFISPPRKEFLFGLHEGDS